MIKIDPEQLNKIFVKATKQVFLDVLETNIELKESVITQVCDPVDRPRYGVDSEVRGIQMDFTGDFDGELFFYYDYVTALELTRSFFKLNDVELEDEELAESIDDILGELTNMTVGLFKSAMLHTDLKCLIGLPKPFLHGTTGVRPDSIVRFRNICSFSLYGKIMLSDIIMYG